MDAKQAAMIAKMLRDLRGEVVMAQVNVDNARHPEHDWIENPLDVADEHLQRARDACDQLLRQVSS